MAEISSKTQSYREVTTEGTIYLKKSNIERIKQSSLDKGGSIHTAEVAGILVAKKTPQ